MDKKEEIFARPRANRHCTKFDDGNSVALPKWHSVVILVDKMAASSVS